MRLHTIRRTILINETDKFFFLVIFIKKKKETKTKIIVVQISEIVRCKI